MIQNAKKQILLLKKPCLLGLSGGPDSMCLFALLLECKKPFHIAHIDHGLRKESMEERLQLEVLAKKHHIPFHTIRLEGFKQTNLEETLRGARLNFFKKVMQEHSLEVLLLGHQQDEQAESVIKRFFEGGSFLHLQGIKQVNNIEGMEIIRPLIQLSKKAVVSYLESKGMFYFIDPTNFTPNNLRGKMRVNLLPLLEVEFGKSIRESVCDIADQVADLSGYLHELILDRIKTAIFGFCGTFYPYLEGSKYIYRMMIFYELNARGITLSRADRRLIKNGIDAQVFGKQMFFPQTILFFEREGIFIINEKSYKVPFAIIEEGVAWEKFWQGEGEVCLEEKEFREVLDKKRVQEFHRIAKTPLCLRRVYPISLTTIEKKIKIETF